MVAYYNENDPRAAAWLRELIKGGHIAPGNVDTRSIRDLEPSDFDGYTQVHLFAGIGGWSYALRLAGWPDDRPVWTGSCPCQPFSSAGKRNGTDDARHLWPQFYRLIRECRPTTVFGEQVASKDGLAWLDIVYADMERADYAIAAADMCAAGVGAPHVRQRLYFVADRSSPRQQSHWRGGSGGLGRELADGSGLGDSDQERQQQHAELYRAPVAGAVAPPCWADPRGPSYVNCQDGKRRPVEPGTFPLAHGVPHRVGLLRGYGNAIVPQLAVQFIGAHLDIT